LACPEAFDALVTEAMRWMHLYLNVGRSNSSAAAARQQSGQRVHVCPTVNPLKFLSSLMKTEEKKAQLKILMMHFDLSFKQF